MKEASEELFFASGLRSRNTADKLLALAESEGVSEAELLADGELLRTYVLRICNTY